MQLDNETSQESIDNPDTPEYRAVEDDADLPNAGGDDSEAQARALGWVPEEEYTGNPAKWADADTFLEVHSRNNGALRKALAAQTKRLDEVERMAKGLDAAHRKIFDMQLKKQKEEFDGQVAFLKAQKLEALRSGEHEEAADLDERIDALRERGPDLPDIPQETQRPADWRQNKTMVAWAERNTWFEKDEDMSAFAGGIGQKIRSDNPSLPFDELLEQVTVRVRKAFPHKFAGNRRNPVEGGTPGETRAAATGKTYASLPSDAKKACDEAVSDGGLTQKQWVELYYGYDDRRKK
jgi:hypothetical protein